MLFIPGKRNEDKKGIIPFFRPRYTKDVPKGTRFCMETSSHKNEIQRHTETEPDFILVKNVHESFTDNRKTNKNVTLQKRSLLCVA